MLTTGRFWREAVIRKIGDVGCAIFIQALNPAWRHFDDDNVWWLETVDHLRWLPAGVDAPFSISNPWRHLLVFTSLFLLLVSLWFGLRNRTSLRAILWALAVNGALLSLFGILQKLSGTYQMFWLWRPSTVNFFATFIYPNQAAPILISSSRSRRVFRSGISDRLRADQRAQALRAS